MYNTSPLNSGRHSTVRTYMPTLEVEDGAFCREH